MLDLKLHASLLCKCRQAYLHLFLHLHSEALTTHASLRALVLRIGAAQRAAWRTLEDLFARNLCLVQYLSHIQV